MKVSIVVPVYGVEQWIEAGLKSIINQRFTDWECVLVNDATKDRSIEIATRFIGELTQQEAIRFRIVEMGHNSGLAAARNRGIREAIGEWLFFLDSDDRFVDDYSLEALVEATNTASDVTVDWVQGNFLRVSPNKTWTTSYYHAQQPVLNREMIKAEFQHLNFTNATNKLIRRQWVTDHELYFNDGYIYEDSYWSLNAYEYVRCVATIPQMTYYHNIRENSVMTSKFSQKKVESLLYINDYMLSKGAERIDANVTTTLFFNSVYLIKNLWLGSFDRRYRAQVMERLEKQGIFRMNVSLDIFPSFSRLLATGLRLPSSTLRFSWVDTLMKGYKTYLNGKQRK